jgi:hypothetical protein
VSDSLGCEHGEWSRWWNGRQTGIPSPIEQNHRHIHLLERVFDDGLVRPPKRLGFMPMTLGSCSLGNSWSVCPNTHEG